MPKSNEDSVERFFRKATSQYDNAFVAQDWQKMEKLLDQKALERTALRTKRLKRAAFTGAALTGIIALVYFLALNQNYPQSRLLSDDISSPKQVQAAAGAEAPIQEQKKENPSAALLFPNKSSSAATVEKREVALQSEETQKSAGNKQQLVSASENQGYQQAGNDIPVQALIPTQHTQEQLPATAASNPEKEKTVAGANVVDNGLSPVIIGPEQAVLKKIDEEEPITSDPAAEESSQKKENTITSRWNVALAISPDFSSTQLTQNYSPGKAFGLMVGYGMTPRFTVSTGVLKSSKKYKGQGNQYQPPEGYWQRRTNGVVPDYIHGRCEVLEIPVVIQYSIRQREKSRIFATAGVSSYVMLSEAYDYIFENSNPGAAPGWRSKGSSSQFLDIGHLSLGYERHLTPAISLGLEPFLKVPFTGIGWSKLDLFTTGAYVNIRYRILNKATVLPGVTKK